MRKPHLLYIAFFYPPSRASGVYRALATSDAFRRNDWDVTVITTTERFFEEEIGSMDPSLLAQIPDGVDVLRVPFSFRPSDTVTDLREMGWLQGNFPQLHSLIRRSTRSARSTIDILRGRSPLSFPMTDRYLTWIEPVVKAGRRVNSSKKVDHVLATGNPYSAFEAARVIADLIGTPFSIDYRDPWRFDMRTGGPAKLDRPTLSAEDRIIEEAALSFHVNQPLADAYVETHPESAPKQKVVMNGFDEESISIIRSEYDGGPLDFGMLGTVTDLWPLGPLFEAWADVRDDLPEGSRLRLAGHLGYFAWSEEGILNTLPGEKDGFYFEGPVEKAKVREFYGSLDVVVVPLFGGPMVTSGKIFEAAGLGIPVVLIQDEDGGARAVLEDHPYAFTAGADPEEIRQALKGAAQAERSITPQDVIETREAMAGFERQRSMQRMVDLVTAATPGLPR